MLKQLMHDIGKLNKIRMDFRENTVDHVSGAVYDALNYGGKQIAVAAVALLFTILNKWQ